jgi:hypothetical protein
MNTNDREAAVSMPSPLESEYDDEAYRRILERSAVRRNCL